MRVSEEQLNQMQNEQAENGQTAESYANRGKDLEELIEQANERYRQTERALVQKIPTPVKVLNINSQTGKITNGFYEQKSTVDYIGTFQGLPIAFDAKETSVKTRFDLSNVKRHQYEYLRDWKANGGVGFLVVFFKSRDEIYYLPFELLDKYWKEKRMGGRKSIPYKAIARDGWLIGGNGLVLVDYLEVIEREVVG